MDIVDAFVIDAEPRGEDALRIVQQLVSLSTAPIIITSADRIEETDKVLGFELGASDYIDQAVWAARIPGAARRRPCAVRPASEAGRERRTYMFGDWTLSMRQRALITTGMSVRQKADCCRIQSSRRIPERTETGPVP